MNHLVSDLIIRIKNACLAKRHKVILPYSKISKEIGKILIKEGYLEDLKEKDQNNKKVLEAEIKYEDRKPVFTNVEIISKPSLRVYINAKDIAKIKKGRLGILILSTNIGIITEKEAKEKGVGGELLFKIW